MRFQLRAGLSLLAMLAMCACSPVQLAAVQTTVRADLAKAQVICQDRATAALIVLPIATQVASTLDPSGKASVALATADAMGTGACAAVNAIYLRAQVTQPVVVTP